MLGFALGSLRHPQLSHSKCATGSASHADPSVPQRGQALLTLHGGAGQQMWPYRINLDCSKGHRSTLSLGAPQGCPVPSTVCGGRVPVCILSPAGCSLSSNLGPGLGQGALRASLLTSNTASIFNWAGNLDLALQLLEMHLSLLFHYCLTDHPDLVAQNNDIHLRWW